MKKICLLLCVWLCSMVVPAISGPTSKILGGVLSCKGQRILDSLTNRHEIVFSVVTGKPVSPISPVVGTPGQWPFRTLSLQQQYFSLGACGHGVKRQTQSLISYENKPSRELLNSSSISNGSDETMDLSFDSDGALQRIPQEEEEQESLLGDLSPSQYVTPLRMQRKLLSPFLFMVNSDRSSDQKSTSPWQYSPLLQCSDLKSVYQYLYSNPGVIAFPALLEDTEKDQRDRAGPLVEIINPIKIDELVVGEGGVSIDASVPVVMSPPADILVVVEPQRKADGILLSNPVSFMKAVCGPDESVSTQPKEVTCVGFSVLATTSPATQQQVKEAVVVLPVDVVDVVASSAQAVSPEVINLGMSPTQASGALLAAFGMSSLIVLLTIPSFRQRCGVIRSLFAQKNRDLWNTMKPDQRMRIIAVLAGLLVSSACVIGGGIAAVRG